MHWRTYVPIDRGTQLLWAAVIAFGVAAAVPWQQRPGTVSPGLAALLAAMALALFATWDYRGARWQQLLPSGIGLVWLAAVAVLAMTGADMVPSLVLATVAALLAILGGIYATQPTVLTFTSGVADRPELPESEDW